MVLQSDVITLCPMGSPQVEPQLHSFTLIVEDGQVSGGRQPYGLRVTRRAGTLAAAIHGAVTELEAHGLRPVRVDAQDWVTLEGIAARIGRAREVVRLWVCARVGPGGFPAPLNPGCRTLFYSWLEVEGWLAATGHLSGVVRADADGPVLAAANLALQLRWLAPRVVDLTSIQAIAYR